MPNNLRKKNSGSVEPNAAANELAGICEVAYLATISDGALEPDEFEFMVDLIHNAFDEEIPKEQIVEILESCRAAFEEDGMETRVSHVASLLTTEEARIMALYVAAGAILGDDEYDPDSEGEFYDTLAEMLEIEDELAVEIWNECVESFSEE